MNNFRSDAVVEAVEKAIWLHSYEFMNHPECRELAVHAIEAMLGQLQMSEWDVMVIANDKAHNCYKRTAWIEGFKRGYLKAFLALGLVRDSDEKIKVDDYDARRHEEMYP